jgi:hypothetical protein
MKQITATWWLAGCLLTPVLLLWSSVSLTGAAAAVGASNAPATDPRLDMATALKAMGPHPSLGIQAKVFGRLVGTWDVQYTNFSKDGKETHRSGEFIVGWVMDGRAIQDVWIVYPSGTRKEREVYMDLRYFDPKSQTWPSTFIDPEHVSVAKFTGGAVGDDRIVLDTQDFGGTDTRWSINDIRPDSFVWREQESLDGGKTWTLQSEYHMKRRGATPPG